MAEPLDKFSAFSSFSPFWGIFGESLALDGEKQKPRLSGALTEPWKILPVGLLTIQHPIQLGSLSLAVVWQDCHYLGCGLCQQENCSECF